MVLACSFVCSRESCSWTLQHWSRGGPDLNWEPSRNFSCSKDCFSTHEPPKEVGFEGQHFLIVIIVYINFQEWQITGKIQSIISPHWEEKASESLLEQVFRSDFSDDFYIDSYEQCGFFGPGLRAHPRFYQSDVGCQPVYTAYSPCHTKAFSEGHLGAPLHPS